MSFKEAIQSCLRQYASFDGRARRSEYWYYALFELLVTGVVIYIFGEESFLVRLVALLLFVPGVAVSWRRLHDIGKNGAWYFIVYLPLVGWIIQLVWMCRDGDCGANMYGEDPKGRRSGTESYGAGYAGEANYQKSEYENDGKWQGTQEQAYTRGKAFCPNCGAPRDGSEKFCTNCGTKLY